MKQVLITGHEGFVGREFQRQMQDWEITGIDIKHGHDCRVFFHDRHHIKYDLVIHLAAVIGGRVGIEREPLSVATDLAIDADFFNWVERTRQERVVYFSSSAAYPVWMQSNGAKRLQESDLSLTHIGEPDMTYGWAKLTGEYLSEFSSAIVHVFRPFSGYGLGQDVTYPFPAYIKRAQERVSPFRIWGPGTQTRDFIHINDIVRAVLTAVDQGFTKPVNLCTGKPTSFNELAGMVTRQAGYFPQIERVQDAPVGVMHRVGDPTLMRTFYSPRIDIQQGVRLALEGRM